MNNSSKPSASVIASGVVAILGALFFLLTGALGLLGILLASRESNPALPSFARSSALVGMAFMIAFAVLGIATGIGPFLLRNWARISALIWAGLSVFFGAVGMVVIYFAAITPPPENLPPQGMLFFRVMLGAIYGVPLLIGIWWLILFNRKAIKAQFTGSVVPVDPSLPQKPRCPTPVAVLAWIFIASALNVLILPFFPNRIPMLFFGHLISPSAGRVFVIFICAVIAVAGVGLLKLKRWSYPLTIGLQFFGLANLSVSALSPNFKTYSDSILAEMERSMPIPNSGFQLAHNPHYFSWGIGFGIACAMTILGILLYYRTRFLELASAAQG